MRKLGLVALAGIFLWACGGAEPAVDAAVPEDASMDGGQVVLCARDSDCDDGAYCSGLERCMPGADGAGADGCVAGAAPCGEGETCAEDEDACVSDDCLEPDADGDGDRRPECGGSDCNDEDGSVYGGANEICDPDGIDEDCNPLTIHSEATSDGDMDGDGFVHTRCFNLRADGTENRGTDCDDQRPTINPVGVETCDGLDNNCDGRTDEDTLSTFYFDYDSDNFGQTDMIMMACVRPDGYALAGGDCDDGETGNAWAPEVHPGVAEECNGYDDDCDGMIDPDCACTNGDTQPCGIDVGACQQGTQTCRDGAWETTCPGEIAPATEVCGGGDEDCDGLTDEAGASGERVFYRDLDGDTYGNPDVTTLACPGPGGAPPAGYVDDNQDCHDFGLLAGDVHPGAGYQTVRYCPGYWCRTSTPYCAPSKPDCVSGTGVAIPMSFDFDCSGAVDVMPRGECESRLGACWVGLDGPLDSHPPDACGEDVPWLECDGALGSTRCRRSAAPDQPLGCR